MRPGAYEILSRVDSVLAGHGVSDEENLRRVQQLLEPVHFVHQLFVDVEAAGGVDDEGVAGKDAGFAAGFAGESLDELRTRGLALEVRLHTDWLRSTWRRL